MGSLGQTIITADVEAETDKAVMVKIGGREVWIPRKVIIHGEFLDVGDSEFFVANWWLDQNGVAV